MIERPDVDTLLAGPLGEWLERQVQVREEARRKSDRRYAIGAAIVLPLLAALWLWLGADWGFEFKIIASLVVAGAAAAWGYAPRAKAIKETKRGINSAIAGSLGLTYEMEFEPGNGFDLARRYALVPSFDRSNFEDRWSGPLGTRAFTLHEAHLEEERGSGKNRRHVTVFRGAILTIAFDRRFHGTTKVERAGKHRAFFGGAKDSIKLDGKQLDYVDMVHPEFADLFSVWSDDQVEARYLVHPVYVERVLAVEQAFQGKDVRTLFSGGELVIVIESEDMFESGSMHASEDRARVQRCVDQFMTLVGLCEALNEPAR
ncbi:MAG TPA: DUF3137 domain-containing protein [Croceibacterium sp.]